MATPTTTDVLLAVSELVGREVALDALLRTLVDRIADAMQADRGTLYLVDRGAGELFSKVAHLPEMPEIRLQLGQGVAGHVAATGETVNVPTAHDERRFFRGVDEKTGYRTESILAAPLHDRAGAIIGVVQLLNKRGGPFTRDDELALGNLAAQAASVIEATTLYAALQRTPADARVPVPLSDRFNRIVGESESMQAAYRLTTRAAASEATVLIRGESGTGKELFARALHVNSKRHDRPFVKVDCAALPASLIENELFGHERGAFTGADQRAIGRFDAANGGTIFLDELGELPPHVQGKLLRVLQDREFDRVGGTRPVPVDVRVVAATNRNLEEMVAAGLFRADLYYRVKVVELRLPPLRERGAADIVRLARHFASSAARKHGRAVPTLGVDALTRLSTYAWPGNVRELENCLESAIVVLEGNLLGEAHLPLPSRPDAPATPRPATPDPVPVPVPVPAPAAHPATTPLRALEDVEREHILGVLQAVDGNRSEAARVLKIGRNTLQRKLKQYGLAD